MPKKSYIIDNWKAIYPVLSAEIPKKEQDAYNNYYNDMEAGIKTGELKKKTPQEICTRLGLKTDPNFLQFGRYCMELKDVFKKEEVKKEDLVYLHNQLNEVDKSLYGQERDEYKKGKQERKNFNFFIGKLIEEELWQIEKTYEKAKDNNLKKVSAGDIFQNEHKVSSPYKINDDLSGTIANLYINLLEVDNNRHINSSEFKAMKKAMTDVYNLFTEANKNNIDVNPHELEENMAVLHEATMKYINAKGIGNQSTQLGKDRMNFAMNVLSLTYNDLAKDAATEYFDAHVQDDFDDENELQYLGGVF